MEIRFWQKNGWPVRYATALGVVVGATLLMAFVRAAWGFPPFLLLAGAVCISAVFVGIGPGIGALILATIASDFFFIEPTFAFSLNRDVWTLSILYGYGAIVGRWFSRRVANSIGKVPPH